jgi:hypothetical protein
MSKRLVFENFEISTAHSIDVRPEDEKAWLDIFEKGYKDGWEDASKMHADGQSAIGVAMSQSLQDLSFTYEEARQTVLRDLEPLLEMLVGSVLPDTLSGSLGSILIERVLAHAKNNLTHDIEIIVSHAEQPSIARLIPKLQNVRCFVEADSNLRGGQAFIRFGQCEERIDLDTVLSDLKALVADYFHEIPNVSEASNG